MSHPKLPSCFAAFLAAATVLFPLPAIGQASPAGRLVEKVACLADPARSYALYLPSSFTARRTWPVLVLFDPAARGPVALGAFRQAAETYGWILAGSNDSRNGPLRESELAAAALWTDLKARVPVDVRRVYAAGFSGGARVASSFSRYAGQPVAGVIGCGAGLAVGVGPETLGASAYFGLIGLADFNYGEMKDLDRAFDPSGLPHRFLFFEGPHDWPGPESCSRAVGWMEILAMKQGLRPVDLELATTLIRRDLEEAQSFETEGRLFWAAGRLEAAAGLAKGMDLDLPELAGSGGRLAGLRSRPEYGRFLAAERKRDRKTAEFRQRFGRAFGAVEDAGAGVAPVAPKVLREMGIAFLRNEAKGETTIEDRALASRLLFEFSFAAQSRAVELYGKRDFGRAGAYLDLAIAACEEGLSREKGLYFDRACVAALSGDEKTALRSLSLAVDKGIDDPALLERDRDLDAIRETDAFRKILERVRAARGVKQIEDRDPHTRYPAGT